MGNCIVLQEKVVKVMKPDGKILEYRAPVRVQQVLSEFSGHAISDSLQDFQHLLPDTKLHGGSLYYLVALPLPSPEVKKKVRFSIPEEENKKETGAVRIKLVISKQELQEILRKGGVSVDYMISQLQGQQRVHRVDTSDNDDCHKGWKPVLESIPEID
ncbi:conserved hypothetical protein [Ricinus communis]|uniref:Uncharacterized protein n=1 Tax=Ricinus communis TaxID=3988 RepID=B9SRY7_RICCO|nr:conserved hypothetical protein [Ricinus communis]|eukprot:XP_002528756.1 uncharacterized protein LOC8267171 [Ricinus communis]